MQNISHPQPVMHSVTFFLELVTFRYICQILELVTFRSRKKLLELVPLPFRYFLTVQSNWFALTAKVNVTYQPRVALVGNLISGAAFKHSFSKVALIDWDSLEPYYFSYQITFITSPCNTLFQGAWAIPIIRLEKWGKFSVLSYSLTSSQTHWKMTDGSVQ